MDKEQISERAKALKEEEEGKREQRKKAYYDELKWAETLAVVCKAGEIEPPHKKWGWFITKCPKCSSKLRKKHWGGEDWGVSLYRCVNCTYEWAISGLWG